jgi:hypothetical protein
MTTGDVISGKPVFVSHNFQKFALLRGKFIFCAMGHIGYILIIQNFMLVEKNVNIPL